MATRGKQLRKRTAPIAMVATLTLTIPACGPPGDLPAPCGEIAFDCGGLELVASAGDDVDVTLDSGSETATVRFDASRSFSRQDLPMEFVWTSALDDTEIAVGQSPTVKLTEGTHFIRLTVTDSMDERATDELSVVVTAQATPRDILCGTLDVSAMGLLIVFFTTMRLHQCARHRH